MCVCERERERGEGEGEGERENEVKDSEFSKAARYITASKARVMKEGECGSSNEAQTRQ